LTSFLPFLPLLLPNDCSKLAKVALMLKAAQELNKILHPFYHQWLQILYSRHWRSFILSIFHSLLLIQLTLLIPVLWRTQQGSSFQLNPILPTCLHHRHRNWLSQGKLMWKILKAIGRNITSYSSIRYAYSTICWRCASTPIALNWHGSSLWPKRGRRLSSWCGDHYLGTMGNGGWDNLVTGWSEWESSNSFENDGDTHPWKW
jgi:hypothetical protein